MWNDIRKTHLAPRALLIDKGGWEVYVLCTRGGGGWVEGRQEGGVSAYVRPVECPRGGEWRLMNNNNVNECLFPFFSRYHFPSFLLDRSRACSSTRIERYICGRKLKNIPGNKISKCVILVLLLYFLRR